MSCGCGEHTNARSVATDATEHDHEPGATTVCPRCDGHRWGLTTKNGLCSLCEGAGIVNVAPAPLPEHEHEHEQDVCEACERAAEQGQRVVGYGPPGKCPNCGRPMDEGERDMKTIVNAIRSASVAPAPLPDAGVEQEFRPYGYTGPHVARMQQPPAPEATGEMSGPGTLYGRIVAYLKTTREIDADACRLLADALPALRGVGETIDALRSSREAERQRADRLEAMYWDLERERDEAREQLAKEREETEAKYRGLDRMLGLVPPPPGDTDADTFMLGPVAGEVHSRLHDAAHDLAAANARAQRLAEAGESIVAMARYYADRFKDADARFAAWAAAKEQKP